MKGTFWRFYHNGNHTAVQFVLSLIANLLNFRACCLIAPSEMRLTIAMPKLAIKTAVVFCVGGILFDRYACVMLTPQLLALIGHVRALIQVFSALLVFGFLLPMPDLKATLELAIIVRVPQFTAIAAPLRAITVILIHGLSCEPSTSLFLKLCIYDLLFRPRNAASIFECGRNKMLQPALPECAGTSRFDVAPGLTAGISLAFFIASFLRSGRKLIVITAESDDIDLSCRQTTERDKETKPYDDRSRRPGIKAQSLKQHYSSHFGL